MKILYLRGVPDKVHAELQAVARQAGLSVTATARAIIARQLGYPHPHGEHVARAIIRHHRSTPDQLPME